MRSIIFFLIFFISVQTSFCQSMGSRSFGMAEASVAVSGKGLLLGNPASQKINEFLFTTGRPQQISGLDQIAFAVHGQVKNLSLETGVHRFGDELASISLLYAGFAHRIGATSLGIRFNLDQFRAEQTNTLTNFSFSAGGITRLGKTVSFGAYIDRISIQADSKNEVMTPVRLSAGVAIEISNSLTTMMSLSQKVNGQPVLRSGLEYRITSAIDLRLGNSFSPSGIFLGTGIKYWNVTTDIAASYRQQEGVIIQATAGYRYNHKKA